MTDHISESENITRALRRIAILYQHFAETLQKELGKDTAKELILKAIYAYGGQIGREAREKALARGLALTPENYPDDLPTIGWTKTVEEADGETVAVVSVCPLASEWQDMDPELAALYCFVDQAKMQAYNPEFTYIHLGNILDGDPCCRLVVRKKT